ncbi:hypothetical protein ATG_16620 [Desulfurococcaceae archaeon AG1]|nr:hypothetical protein ATG_16620 [Desulfurococcaceae archaeon AG1]
MVKAKAWFMLMGSGDVCRKHCVLSCKLLPYIYVESGTVLRLDKMILGDRYGCGWSRAS